MNLHTHAHARPCLYAFWFHTCEFLYNQRLVTARTCTHCAPLGVVSRVGGRTGPMRQVMWLNTILQVYCKQTTLAVQGINLYTTLYSGEYRKSVVLNVCKQYTEVTGTTSIGYNKINLHSFCKHYFSFVKFVIFIWSVRLLQQSVVISVQRRIEMRQPSSQM